MVTPEQPHAPTPSVAGPLVVGVVPQQPEAVLSAAAQLATRLGEELVLAYVDVTRYLDPQGADAESAAIDPDEMDDAESVATALSAHIALALESFELGWRFVRLAGEPAHALAQLADSVGAGMIVVGTREPGVVPKLGELLTGSMAAHLTHRQNRPVVVIPLARGRGRSA